MLLHLHSVSKNHVQVEHQILDLQFQTYIYQMKKKFLTCSTSFSSKTVNKMMVAVHLLWERCVPQL